MATEVCGTLPVVGVPGPVNVTPQLNAKAKPFLAHIDKVKFYCADVMPKSWLTTDLNGYGARFKRRT